MLLGSSHPYPWLILEEHGRKNDDDDDEMSELLLLLLFTADDAPKFQLQSTMED